MLYDDRSFLVYVECFREPQCRCFTAGMANLLEEKENVEDGPMFLSWWLRRVCWKAWSSYLPWALLEANSTCSLSPVLGLLYPLLRWVSLLGSGTGVGFHHQSTNGQRKNYRKLVSFVQRDLGVSQLHCKVDCSHITTGTTSPAFYCPWHFLVKSLILIVLW